MKNHQQRRVVVITGASSGIGRATALAFAHTKAQLVLAARREHLLHEVAALCVEQGAAEAIAVPTDVTDEQAVQQLARHAFDHFGRIDVWVNNAGVGVFGLFEHIPPEVFRRVIDTNLFGNIHGARSVLPYFRTQGSGVLINVASLVGAVAIPNSSAYSISKFGIRAFGQSLRQEIERMEGLPIHICTIMPACIDTPFFRHSANYSGRIAEALPPIYPAEQLAEAIVKCAARPRREVFVGNSGYLFAFWHFFTPALVEAFVARQVKSSSLKEPSTPSSEGNLFIPMQEGSGVSDGWRKETRQATTGRQLTGITLLGILSGILAWTWYRIRQKLVTGNN